MVKTFGKFGTPWVVGSESVRSGEPGAQSLVPQPIQLSGKIGIGRQETLQCDSTCFFQGQYYFDYRHGARFIQIRDSRKIYHENLPFPYIHLPAMQNGNILVLYGQTVTIKYLQLFGIINDTENDRGIISFPQNPFDLNLILLNDPEGTNYGLYEMKRRRKCNNKLRRSCLKVVLENKFATTSRYHVVQCCQAVTFFTIFTKHFWQ